MRTNQTKLSQKSGRGMLAVDYINELLVKDTWGIRTSFKCAILKDSQAYICICEVNSIKNAVLKNSKFNICGCKEGRFESTAIKYRSTKIGSIKNNIYNFVETNSYVAELAMLKINVAIFFIKPHPLRSSYLEEHFSSFDQNLRWLLPIVCANFYSPFEACFALWMYLSDRWSFFSILEKPVVSRAFAYKRCQKLLAMKVVVLFIYLCEFRDSANAAYSSRYFLLADHACCILESISVKCFLRYRRLDVRRCASPKKQDKSQKSRCDQRKISEALCLTINYPVVPRKIKVCVDPVVNGNNSSCNYKQSKSDCAASQTATVCGLYRLLQTSAENINSRENTQNAPLSTVAGFICTSLQFQVLVVSCCCFWGLLHE